MEQGEYLSSVSSNKKIFVLLVAIMFTIFLFTNNGHRYTIDEDQAQLLAKRIATQIPHPLYVQGQSRMLFEYPTLFPSPVGPICQNPLLCSPVDIGYGITEVPFVFLNHQINQVHTLNYFVSENNFNDTSYVYWRNSLDPDFLLLQLLYGPLFAALSVGIFFLICRTFNYSEKTSLILSLLYGMSTLVWAYSKTSLNSVPVTAFILLGYWFFRRHQKTKSIPSLLLCTTSLGFGYLIRMEVIFIIAPLFILLLLDFRGNGKKLKKLFAFILPIIGAFMLQKFIDYLNFGSQGVGVASGSTSRITTLTHLICMSDQWSCTVLYEGSLGLLFSPGVGLLIFAPILFTIFFSFPEFYKKNKKEFYLFIVILAVFLWYFGQTDAWHGLNAWGPRYLFPIIPFLLLPLGTSIEKRGRRFVTIICILGVIGAFFNFVYVVQDVPYFVWGPFGVPAPFAHGLYSLAATGADKYSINPTVLWTFENSELTHSIILAFTHLQVDIFFFIQLGSLSYLIIFGGIVLFLSTLLIKQFGIEINIFNKSSKKNSLHLSSNS
ncbi:MAG: glycosyltransferase family 39 protein [Nitrosotalea sp.]